MSNIPELSNEIRAARPIPGGGQIEVRGNPYPRLMTRLDKIPLIEILHEKANSRSLFRFKLLIPHC